VWTERVSCGREQRIRGDFQMGKNSVDAKREKRKKRRSLERQRHSKAAHGHVKTWAVVTAVRS